MTYEGLLELFWQSHNPARAAFKVQYASLILSRDDGQLAAARESAERYERLFGRQAATRIELLKRFWLAEDYHQKYYLRNDRTVMAEFRAAYPDDAAFVASTAAARANGYLYGGHCVRLERDLPGLGLSDRAAARLKAHCR